VWSPDNQWIAYNGVRAKNGIYRKPANGMGQEEELLAGDTMTRSVLDWSPDGRFLLFGFGDRTAKGQLWVLPLAGDRKPTPVTPDTYVVNSARFSPDGHWLSYSSNESGRFEVYVVPYGGGTGKWQISAAGGAQPVWRRDGKELFYWTQDNMLMSVPITLRPQGIELGAARMLFRFNRAVGTVGIISPYDVSADGARRLDYHAGGTQADHAGDQLDRGPETLILKNRSAVPLYANPPRT
jgi:eukaryotic-like serine/threonine-protein kinase